MFYKILSVFIGGGLGTLLRFGTYEICRKYFMLPVFGTFLVNITGCFILGFVFGIIINEIWNIPNTLKLFITVGFLGGLTTFSTFNLEIFEMIRDGKFLSALCYMLSSCVLGLLFTYFGYLISRT